MKSAEVGLCIVLTLLMCTTWVLGQGFSLNTFGNHDSIGCEANPTGNPIGGGEGYDDIYATGDFTVSDREQLIAALRQAQPGQVIFVPDGVEIDLTGHSNLVVLEKVTLASNRGKDGSGGARLFTRDFGVLFRSGGDHVRFTGLRFEGPYGGSERIAGSATFISIGHYGTRVDNCEIYNFNYSGISVSRAAADTWIHHNYLHHIQRGGLGYPVVIDSSTTVYIIANMFDYGRHYIASTGAPGSGYEAAWNLVMDNATSHNFDMHGGSARGDATNIAGDWMHIHHNTFLSSRYPIGIGGTPSGGAEIHNNWFARPVDELTYTWMHTNNIRVFRNAWGPDKILQEHDICYVNGEQTRCEVERCNFCR